jgi:DNA-binding MarR family transcriptional regulator
MTVNEKLAELEEFKKNKERLIGRLLTKSYRLMRVIASEFLAHKGYTNFKVGHMVALIHIDLEGSNINTIANNACVTKQAMSKQIKELQDDGFVTTQKHPKDARTVIVKLTDKGIDAMMNWKECTAFIDSKFNTIIGAEKLEQVKDILSILARHYEKNVEESEAMSEKNILQMNLVDSKSDS